MRGLREEGEAEYLLGGKISTFLRTPGHGSRTADWEGSAQLSSPGEVCSPVPHEQNGVSSWERFALFFGAFLGFILCQT